MKIFRIIVLLLVSTNLFAQKPKPAKPTGFVKFKAPKLTTSLGSFKDTMYIAPQMADSIIGLSLKVTDAKNVVYSISSYQFLYKKIVTTEDEKTGRTSKTSSIKSSLFKTSPLPNLWLNAVRENLSSGEEFFFFAVTVKDPQGRLMYAP
ncbi:MAG: hypothetical protein LH615_01330, partial [Ferruginibacter sp.]|nr:hypothetical protein [Ferruginibacter sp.]